MHDAINRPQSERRAERIDRTLQLAVDHRAIRQPEERALEPHRLSRGDADVPGHPLIDQAADDAGLQVDGRERDAEPLLRDARAERDPRGGDDGAFVRVAFDCAIDRLDRRDHRFASDHAEALARVPQIRIRHRAPGVFGRAERDEAEALRFDQLLEDGVGDDGRAMAARPERDAQADDGVNVAGAADRREKNVKQSRRDVAHRGAGYGLVSVLNASLAMSGGSVWRPSNST